MVASIRIGTLASYYAREYYHGGEHLIASAWFARGAHFGVLDGAPVDIDQFTRLHAGLDADGASLLTTSGRTVEGVDITFSPGKSISLCYGLTTDKELQRDILAAHQAAVHAALTVLDDEAIFARRGRNGLQREKVCLTAALFTHDSARPARHLDGSIFPDPQIHTHAVCLNLALRTSDGTIGGIDTRVGPFKLMAGAVYHAHLAYELSRRFGFKIQEIGRNGIFEIGFDPKTRKYFSARRDQVVEELAEIGLDTASAPALAAVAAVKTRRNKDSALGDERFLLWRSKAADLGLDVEHCVEHLRNRRNARSLGNDRDYAKALASVPELLTEFEAAFSRKDLIRAVVNARAGAILAQAKLVCCGDSSQLQPIAAASGIALIRIATENAKIEKVVRQRDPQMRRAVEHLANHNPRAGYKILESLGCILEVEGRKSVITTAVDRWTAARQDRPDKNHLLIARSNATVRALNTEIRKRLREAGQLQGRDVAIAASSASGEAYTLRLARGDRLRFGIRADIAGQRIINGTTATIEQVEPDGEDHAIVTARIGRRRLSFSTTAVADDHGRARLAHDYAATVFSSQGLTAETCTAVLDPHYDRNSLYVAASRSRGQLSLIIDCVEIDAHVKAERPSTANYQDATAEERRAILLRWFSRESVKTSTLDPGDLVETKSPEIRSAAQERRRNRELSHEL